MATRKNTIESKTADAVLQREQEVRVGDVTYEVAPPSCATLILVSEAVAQLPAVDKDNADVVQGVLRYAKDCGALGDIVAILILGAKGLKGSEKVVRRRTKRRFFGLFKTTVEVEETRAVDRKSDLSRRLLEDVTPRELQNICVRLLNSMQIGDFFGLTTFLSEINLTKETKVGETTASGR